jgi:hypothetical protein
MTCYQISEGGEPVAFVARKEMAQGIIQCQPHGHYAVDEVHVDDPPASRKSGRTRGPRSGDLGAQGRQDRPPQRWRYRGIGTSLVMRNASTNSTKG